MLEWAESYKTFKTLKSFFKVLVWSFQTGDDDKVKEDEDDDDDDEDDDGALLDFDN